MGTASDYQASVPEWTLGWRLQRALAHADLKAEQMAAELEVSRSTVSRWMHDRGAPPRGLYVKQWALRCGVPYAWLATGAEPEHPGGPDEGGGQPISQSRCTALGPRHEARALRLVISSCAA